LEDEEETTESQLPASVKVDVRLPVDGFFQELMQALLAGNQKDKVLADLLPEACRLLNRALSLLTATGEIREGYDYSHIHYPSIFPHSQNESCSSGKWYDLIEVVRESWLAKLESDPDEARSWAMELSQASRFTLAFGKQAFYHQVDLEEAAAYGYAKEAIAMNALAEDAQEGMTAFLEKRQPEWRDR
jgi:hypothetical protein